MSSPPPLPASCKSLADIESGNVSRYTTLYCCLIEGMICRKMIDNNFIITNYALYAFISVPDSDEIDYANPK